MLFQTLDDKKKCIGIYQNGKFYYDKLPDNISKTWNYVPSLGNKAEYAIFYAQGLNLGEACPRYLQPEWERITLKLKAFLRAFEEAKISLDDNCFFDLVPDSFLIEFCELKNMITDHVFKTFQKPSNYDFLVDLAKLTNDISVRNLNYDVSLIKSQITNIKVRSFNKKIKESAPYIKYNIFGTKTGRLSTYKKSFPILTLPCQHRKILRPTNDWFLELDYNAAELRTVLSLSGFEQPQEDLHLWNSQNIYSDRYNREESKKKILAWLYNPSAKHKGASKVYDRDYILNHYWSEAKGVQTHFGRRIESDRRHALNYIVQSTCADMTLRQIIKVSKFLEGKKSHVAFCLHDSVVIDLSYEDRSLIKNLINIFSNTDNMGKYFVNTSVGKDFGNMKKIKDLA